jgi:transcription antitermination factor NusG
MSSRITGGKAMAITKKPSARTHCPPGSYTRTRPDMDAPPSGEWFAVVCNPGCERKARDGLAEPLFRTYLPMTAKIEKVGGRRKLKAVVERPLFPRYLFVCSRTGALPFYFLRSVKGVESIVRSEGRPLAIPHAIIAELMRRDAAGDFDDSKQKRKKTLEDSGYSQGEIVTVLKGAFYGFEAKIQALMPGNKAKVLISIFGNPNPVILPLAELEKCA